MAIYEIQKSGGDQCQDGRDMFVYLYPNKNGEISYTDASTSSDNQILNTLDQMGQTLVNAGSISYYEILRFKAEDYIKPKFAENEIGGCSFLDYLKGPDTACNLSGWKNGTGDDLTGIRGSHLLLHSYDCVVDNVGGVGGEGDCTTPSAFTESGLVWSSVSCSDSDLTLNSARQEPLHGFILQKKNRVKDLIADCDGNGEIDLINEHALGQVYRDTNTNKISPLLTYHADEEEFDCGDCATGLAPGDWTQQLTTCTKDAVQYTADDLCNSVIDQC